MLRYYKNGGYEEYKDGNKIVAWATCTKLYGWWDVILRVGKTQTKKEDLIIYEKVSSEKKEKILNTYLKKFKSCENSKIRYNIKRKHYANIT